MNINNKKGGSVPGILIVFMLIVLGGFSGLTFAVAGKIADTDFSFAKSGLSNIASLISKEIVVNDENANNNTAVIFSKTTDTDYNAQTENQTNQQQNGEISLFPISLPTETPNNPSPRSAVTKITVFPTASPIPAPEKQNLPPTPTPDSPANPEPAVSLSATVCSTPPLHYRVRYIDGAFYLNNFDREKLKNIVLYAESQWESAINADVFKYDGDNIKANSIDFASNTSVVYNNDESGQFGITQTTDADNNELTDKFQTTIFREIFYMINSGNTTYIGSLNKNYTLAESVITRAVMHQMGHILGLGHILGEPTDIMAPNWIPTTYKPTLTESDINQIKKLCK